MNTEQALLCAILESPADDLPRLAYSDWLEEHGQPERAEFIRVECEADRTHWNSPTHSQLLRRLDQLLAVHRAEWFGPLAEEDRIVRFIITRRGFIDRVVLTASAFTAHADLIFAHAPLLRELHVVAGGDWRPFFASPRMSAIRSLSFEDEVFTRDAAEGLTASAHVNALVKLELDRQPLGPDGMAAVASAQLRGLERLSAGESGIGDGGAQELFASETFQNLRSLNLSQNGLTDAACLALAAASGFGRLEGLGLSNNRITAAGVSALAAAPHLGRLKSLYLNSNPLGPAGGRAILASRHWGELVDLSLFGCGVGVAVAGDLRWVYGDRAIKV